MLEELSSPDTTLETSGRGSKKEKSDLLPLFPGWAESVIGSVNQKKEARFGQPVSAVGRGCER